MDKGMRSSVASLLIDVAMVCGLMYGGWAANISLGFYWVTQIIVIIFIANKGIPKRENNSKASIAIMFTGSFILFLGLVYNGHYITLTMFIITEIVLAYFRLFGERGANNG